MCEMNEDKTAIDKNTLIQNIKHLDGWSLKKRDTIIERNFTFNNFKDITLFLNHLIKHSVLPSQPIDYLHAYQNYILTSLQNS